MAGTHGDRTAEPESIIRIEHLSKVFRDGRRQVKAVDDVSFEVQKGEIFGLLGPNGAGKSTIIRILTTLLRPTSGKAFVGPYDVVRHPEEIRRVIGVCPQTSTLDLELTAYDNLDFYGNLLDIDPRHLDARIRELLDMADLTDRAHAPVQTLSGGMRRKLEIVRAFIHRPLILFLDEPTIGLDPESRREVWQQVTALNQEETTIILTTHYMDEAEKFCDRIAFVDRGRLLRLDTTENLKHSLPAGDVIEIGIEAVDEEALRDLRADRRLTSVEVREHKLIISAENGSRLLPSIVETFERHAIPMTSIAIRSPSIEDVFIYLTGRRLDGGRGEPAGPPRKRGDRP
ncbi:ATP-binding cassette domain-containing protein [Methanofollis fontis]|uniref:Daunorubicin ABC transporter ATP-binding protein n=1 Tax=Methanofollis fontis TaxID=2052832 RepID=A0A483CWU8_9EURY|nr:ATP-binding cassette domain-containing protein [Methanofollis fontis]TAJ45730.1 daunorubicin ABC transporter ATP-binding protein [Methanofollis fontis]